MRPDNENKKVKTLKLKNFDVVIGFEKQTQFSPLGPYNQYIVSGNSHVIAHFTCERHMYEYMDMLFHTGFKGFDKGIMDILEKLQPIKG